MEQPRFTSLHLSIILFGVVTLVVLFILSFFHIALPISITTTQTSGELSVVGEGKVDVVPDTTEVSGGITVNNVKTAQEAEQKISEVNNKIIEAVVALGVKKEDIKTSNFSVNQDYSIAPLPADSVIGRPQTPSGYAGNATVTVKVREVAKVGEVINAMTAAGANNVYNSGSSVDDPSKYREEARNKAIQNAKEQAQKLSQQLGIRLGRVTNIVESSGGIPPMYYGKEAAMSARPADTVIPDIEPGSQIISSTVTLFFERN